MQFKEGQITAEAGKPKGLTNRVPGKGSGCQMAVVNGEPAPAAGNHAGAASSGGAATEPSPTESAAQVLNLTKQPSCLQTMGKPTMDTVEGSLELAHQRQWKNATTGQLIPASQVQQIFQNLIPKIRYSDKSIEHIRKLQI